ncbi:MAG: tRNA (guanosine(18)-2'-O)-methyltransferase TrmH [Deinococcota bacterium]
MTAARYQKIQAVLAKRQADLTIFAEHIHKPHNLSAMLRSCDAVGIGTVYAFNPTGGVPTYNETSASANKWINLQVYERTRDVLEILRAQNMQILATRVSDSAVNYLEVDYTVPTCIVMGNERDGISDEVAEAADQHIIVPMVGMVQSLNVSVATAVILFEAQRQRRAKGMYDRPRLSAQDRAAQTFKWLYSKQAARLDEAGLPYPELDDDGYIIKSSAVTAS